MPVKGLKDAKRSAVTLIETVTMKAERGVTAALITGMAFSDLLTPIDTSFLINSKFRSISVGGTKVMGIVGYSARYAAAVHNASGKLKGKPRKHFGKTRYGVEFGGGTGVGKYWDPKAEPQFLKKGFEDNRDKVNEAMERAMKL